MRHLAKIPLIPVVIVVVVGNAAAVTPIPPFAQVRQTVLQYFAKQPNYETGDLITADQVTKLLEQLRRQGLPLADGAQIVAQTPAAGEFLVEQLGSAAGRQFMQRIARYPQAYDRLDRLSRMPQGQQTVRDLIRGPGGDKLIEYLTTADGGKELGKMLSGTPTGKDFNSPTGRIYTVALLSDRLQQSHQAAVRAASKRK